MTKHHLAPAPNSTERTAWDQLTATEKDTVTLWRDSDSNDAVALPDDPTRRRLCLAALGYGSGHVIG